jgi:hypothetical protein
MISLTVSGESKGFGLRRLGKAFNPDQSALSSREAQR